MASSYYGSGYVPLQPSSFVPEKPRNDPNWEINTVSEEQTSIFTEPITSRLCFAVGFLQPRSLDDQIVRTKTDPDDDTSPFVWSVANNGQGEPLRLQFYFSDVEIQNCYGIQVEHISVEGIPRFEAIDVGGRTGVCADVIDDELASSTNFYAFNNTVIRSRTAHDISIRESFSRKIHLINLFSNNGNEFDGFYSPEKLFQLIKERIREKLRVLYSNTDIHLEFYFDSVEERFILAWKLPLAVTNIVGGIEIALNKGGSPILSLFEKYFIFENVKKNYYTYGSVSQGDGISMVRRRVENVSGRTAGNLLSSIGLYSTLMVAVSSELSKFQKNDSITPISTTGEIAVFTPFAVETTDDYLGSGNVDTRNFRANMAEGSLFSPKLPFDPNETLNSFSITLYVPTNSLVMKALLESAYLEYESITSTQEDEIRKRLHLVVGMRLF